jgi:single-strand DNA-binding protein
VNKIILIGRLTRDPELRTTSTSGIPVATFSLAVDRPFAKDGQQEVDFIDCVAWRGLGETVAKFMTKGRLVAVAGRLQIRAYETQDGQKRRAAEVVADEVRFLDGKKDGGTQPNAPDSVALPEELPF